MLFQAPFRVPHSFSGGAGARDFTPLRVPHSFSEEAGAHAKNLYLDLLSNFP